MFQIGMIAFQIADWNINVPTLVRYTEKGNETDIPRKLMGRGRDCGSNLTSMEMDFCP